MNIKPIITATVLAFTFLLCSCAPTLPEFRTKYWPKTGMTKDQVANLSLKDGKTFNPHSLFTSETEGSFIMDAKTKTPMAILVGYDINNRVYSYIVKYQVPRGATGDFKNELINFLEHRYETKFGINSKGKGHVAEIPKHQIFVNNDVSKSTVSFAVVKTEATASSSRQNNTWLQAGGRIWTGVKLYYGKGNDKRYVGEVLGGNDHYVAPLSGQRFRGVKIRMKSGSVEWKDRSYVATSDWYIRSDDPALKKMDWAVYED